MPILDLGDVQATEVAEFGSWVFVFAKDAGTSNQIAVFYLFGDGFAFWTDLKPAIIQVLNRFIRNLSFVNFLS